MNESRMCHGTDKYIEQTRLKLLALICVFTFNDSDIFQEMDIPLADQIAPFITRNYASHALNKSVEMSIYSLFLDIRFCAVLRIHFSII